MEIIYKEQNGKLFGSTKALGIGKRQPELIYGTKAKELREKAGLTIEELANKFKMKPFDLERLEEQKQALTDKIYEKYNKEFNVDKEYFFDLDLETLIITLEGHIIASYDNSKDCKEAYDSIMNDYFKFIYDEDVKRYIIDFSINKTI